MRSKIMLTGIAGGVFMGVLLSAVFVMAGDLAPSAGPTEAGSQMYTLEQIYDRLTTGAAGDQGNKIHRARQRAGGNGPYPR